MAAPCAGSVTDSLVVSLKPTVTPSTILRYMRNGPEVVVPSLAVESSTNRKSALSWAVTVKVARQVPVPPAAIGPAIVQPTLGSGGLVWSVSLSARLTLLTVMVFPVASVPAFSTLKSILIIWPTWPELGYAACRCILVVASSS